MATSSDTMPLEQGFDLNSLLSIFMEEDILDDLGIRIETVFDGASREYGGKRYGRTSEESKAANDLIVRIKNAEAELGRLNRAKDRGEIDDASNKGRQNVAADLRRMREELNTIPVNEGKQTFVREGPSKRQLLSQALDSLGDVRSLDPTALNMNDLPKDVLKQLQQAGVTSTDFQRAVRQQQNVLIQEEIEAQNLKQLLEAQKQIHDPVAREKLISDIFSPATTQFNQYFKPQGGASVSQAQMQANEQASAQGLGGKDRQINEELGRQELMAKERLESEKAAFRGQITTQALQNPAQLYGLAQGAGQFARSFAGQLQGASQQPLMSLFPQITQAEQLRLQPFQFAQPVQQGGGGLGPLGIAGTVLGGVGGLAGSLFGAAGAAGGFGKLFG